MPNEKNKIEALLFTVAKRIHIGEISKITGIRNQEKINSALSELQTEYEAKGTSVTLRDEGGGFWKMTVKDHYMPMVQKVISRTELDKPLMETLAVIAWKYPVVQSDVIKIRHNKAYDHLKQLEELGFITRQKYGRTNKLTLTQKFFEYFDLPSKEQAKEVFRKVVPQEIKEKVEKTEQEIDDAEKKIEEYNKMKEEKNKADADNPEKDEESQKNIIKEKTKDNTDNPDKEKFGTENFKENSGQIEELQKKEDSEIEQIEKDTDIIDKEESKEIYEKDTSSSE